MSSRLSLRGAVIVAACLGLGFGSTACTSKRTGGPPPTFTDSGTDGGQSDGQLRFDGESSSCSDSMRNGDESAIDCGGSCPPCGGGEQCRNNSDCETNMCDNNSCTAPGCDDRMRNGDETDVDCGGSCTDCLDQAMCGGNEDCASQICTGGHCAIPRCNDDVQNGGETGMDCGGPCARGCALGEPCESRSDCESRACENSVCSEYDCSDSFMSPAESDVDCGGPCGGCANGRMCREDGDCMSQICRGNACQPPGCTDGIRNGNELGIDCGSGCPPCADGTMCNVAGDCMSGVCAAGMTCATPTCTDHVRNGMETDVDCGGGCPGCAHRLHCSVPSDCMENTCTSNRCGVFQGCSVALISQETQLTNATITGILDAGDHLYDQYTMNCTGLASACTMGGVHSLNSTLLHDYRIVILNKHDRAITTAERDVLQGYVNSGGRLLVTGYDSLASPLDANLAQVVNCTFPAGMMGGDLYGDRFNIVNTTHPIMVGPATGITLTSMLVSTTRDHDECLPGPNAVQLATVTEQYLPSDPAVVGSKLQITENVGAGHGMVVYWNGNGYSTALSDWVGPTTATESSTNLQNLFRNTLNYLCHGGT